jgi:hypothetical protein
VLRHALLHNNFTAHNALEVTKRWAVHLCCTITVLRTGDKHLQAVMQCVICNSEETNSQGNECT